MNKDKFKSREVAEQAEGYEQVSSQVPENRMQNQQQIQPTSAAEGVKAPKSSFSKGTANGKGVTLKQEKISEALTGSVESAGMGINAAGRGVSGTFDGILGANNSTPQATKSRSDSRVGKKLDRVANKLNYTPCEQSLVPVRESKPLADAADEDQGYNGTYRNEDARSQKIAGAVPADLMFQRSVDFITKDKLYFLEGQQVYQNGIGNEVEDEHHNVIGYDGDRYILNPTKVYDSENEEWVDQYMKSGDYLTTGMHIGLNPDGSAHTVYFDVQDITPGDVSADDANVASAHRLIKSNVAELDRMNMDAKAGDEKADIWTPLARAVEEPTKWSYLLSSIEAETGGYVHMAYSKATTNMAFQLNRAAKDGLDTLGPAIEQFVGWRNITDNSVDLRGSTKSLHELFTASNYAAGDPSLMIAAYDSIAKYNNKADLLLQPRGWRMHLQTADNNMNTFKVPKEYANVFSGTEVYSTIDRDYDPILPICFTDKANLIVHHNFNDYCCYYGKAIKNAQIDYTSTAVDDNPMYAHYELKIYDKKAHQVTGENGLYMWLGKTAGDGLEFDETTGIINLDADSANGDKSVKVAFTRSSTTKPADDSTYNYVLVTWDTNKSDITTLDKDIILYVPTVQDGDSKISAVELTETITNNTFKLHHFNKEVLPLKYNYSDLRNDYNVTVKHPLIYGILEYLKNEIGAKLYTLLPANKELYIPFIFSTQNMTLAQLFICAATPWIQRVREQSMKDVIYYEDNVHEYPFSKLDSIKNVPFKNYVNFNFSDYDHPLETKVMNPVQAISWVMPEFFWKVATEKYVLPFYFNENELNSDGTVNEDGSAISMPSIRDGIHFSFFDTLYGMSEKDIRLSLDRMTRTFLDDDIFSSFNVYKYGRTTDGQPLANLDSGKVISVQKILSTPRELGLQMDCPIGVLTKDPVDSGAYKSFSSDGTGTSFRIRIYCNTNAYTHPDILAKTGVNIDRAANYVQKWQELFANNSSSYGDINGLVFGMNDDTHTFSPFAVLGTGASASNSVNVTSYMRSVNTRLQFLPFIISPFDGNGVSGSNHDIYDFAYFFGLAGFRASDYRESVYNRVKEVINQGFLFTEDPWILASPIMKGASSSTGISLNKGYTLSK